jgi:CDP-glycerol glycerophosphotransferase (TagB/SpsB family)
VWRIFSPHNVALDIHRQYSDNNGKNVIVTGYPAMEPFLDKTYTSVSSWKKQDKNKFKIIWAPHHTIDMPQLPYANFLKYADFFIKLVQRCQDTIQWAFKPHPILKPKLINHRDWGQEKTEGFWSFWENQPNCQLEEGEYVDLFLTSDAMIHDSGSFLAEYLYTNKPVLYLTSSTDMKEYFNQFGCEAFDACYHAFNEQDIEEFIANLFEGKDTMQLKRQFFLEKHVLPFFKDKTPSDLIIETIKRDFGMLISQ